MERVISLRAREKETALREQTPKARKDVNTPVSEEEISEKAHELFLKRGRAPRDDWSDWFEAKRQLEQLEEVLQ